jgi:acyl dehydratase
MSQISNYTFDEISIGQTASYSRVITEREIILFAAASGDVNPVHLDAEFAAQSMFKQRIAHGMLTGGVISAALALVLPGPGCVYLGQTLRFQKPVKIGDELTARLEVTAKREDKEILTIECEVLNQHGTAVASGTATIKAPGEKIVIDEPSAPRVTIET